MAVPFQMRADHIGSFLRPADLLEARREAAKDPARLRGLEDAHIRNVLNKQKELGFEVFTDGELRRRNFMSDFTDAVEGFDLGDAVARDWQAGQEKNQPVSSVAGIVNKTLRQARALTGHELPFLKANSPGPIKMTLPSATQFPAISFKRGQCCCAGSRLYVEKKVFDKVVEGMAKSAEKIRVKPGFEPDSDMGPLVSQEQLNRVCGYLESGKKEGAKAVTGGERHGDQGYFVKPTVLVDTTENMKVVQEEIFGPVVAAIPFSDPAEVVDKANNSIYGLAAGIWTRDIKKAHKLANKLRAGTVWINCYNVFDPALPFGGYKQSGWGREMGHEVLEHYTEVKSVCAAL